MLYRIKRPNIRRLALVERPASGHTWHLFKSAPSDDAELDALASELNEAQASAILRELERQDEADRLKLAKEAIANEQAARHRAAAAALAKSQPEDRASGSAIPDLARLAEQLQHSEIAERQRRILPELRNRPQHPTSWMYNTPTATAEQTADYVQRLARADKR